MLFALDQGSGAMAFYRDRFYYWLPQYDACRQALAAGEVPLWNPFLNCGQPLLATWQIALGSPLALPFLVWPFDTALRVFWVLALGLAAGAMYALARRARVAPFGAAVAATLYAGSGPIRTLGEWPNIVAGLALLPLAPLTADLAVTRSPGGRTAAVLVAGLLILSGQPRTVALAALLTGAWILLRHGIDRRAWQRLLPPLAAGAAVAAIQLLPTIDLYLQSSRRAAGIPWGTVDESFLHWQDLLTLLSPRALGDERTFWGPGRLLMPRLYLGLAGLWLLWRGWQAGGFPRRLAGWLVPVALLISLGSPLYAALLRQFDAAPRLRYLGHAVLACWPAVCLLAGAGAVRLQDNRALALFTCIGVDLLWSFHGYEVKVRPEDLLKPAREASAGISGGRVFSPIWLQQVYDDTAGVPIANRYAARAALLAPNLPQLTGLVNVSGYEPFSLASHAELFAGWVPRVEAPRDGRGGQPRDPKALAAALQATGARWMTGPKEEALPGWTLRAEPFPAWGLWEHRDPGPTARVVSGTARYESWRSLVRADDLGSARLRMAGPSSLHVHATLNAATGTVLPLIVLAIPYCRGWTIEGGGRPIRAGGVFMALPYPTHAPAVDVQLTYAPLSFALGLWISLLALGALLGMHALPEPRPALRP